MQASKTGRPKRSQQPAEASAPALLLRSAEKSLAIHGLDGVSIARIVRDAGQRNVSAIHYHFGDRANLIREILRNRLNDVNARRAAVVAALPNGTEGATFRELVSVLVLPLADMLFSEPSASHYVRFLHQVRSHPDYRDLLLEWANIAPAYIAATTAIERRLYYLDAEIRAIRLDALRDYTLASLAYIETLVGEMPHRDLRLRISNLIDNLSAALETVASPETISALGGRP